MWPTSPLGGPGKLSNDGHGNRMTTLIVLNLVIGFGVPLAVGIGVLLLLRRAVSVAQTGDRAAIWRSARRAAVWVGAAVFVVVSLFSGFVGAAILGAVAPGTVGFAAELACDGTVDHYFYGYSYKPGQSGTSQEWTCTSASGEKERIVGMTFVYAGLVFSAGAAVALGVLVIAAWLIGRRCHQTVCTS